MISRFPDAAKGRRVMCVQHSRWKSAEAFNLLNHANFGAATTSISSGYFGKILTSGAPRICEFALKDVF